MKNNNQILLIIGFLMLSLSVFAQDVKQGQIYFIRYTGATGILYNDRVYIDNKQVCKLKNNKYSVHEVTTGEHIITIKGGGIQTVNETPLKIIVEEGKINYIEIVSHSGVIETEVYCQEINENSADVILKKTKKVKDCDTGRWK